jgi:hypothetical protein
MTLFFTFGENLVKLIEKENTISMHVNMIDQRLVSRLLATEKFFNVTDGLSSGMLEAISKKLGINLRQPDNDFPGLVDGDFCIVAEFSQPTRDFLANKGSINVTDKEVADAEVKFYGLHIILLPILAETRSEKKEI